MRTHAPEPAVGNKLPTVRQNAKPGNNHAVLSPQALLQAAPQAGNSGLAASYAAGLNRATGSRPARAGPALLQLQRQYGNRYIQRVVALARQPESTAEVAPDTERAIENARGGGQPLDGKTRADMESAFGADFSGVRVYTDSTADSLGHDLSARAFTTGQDIFFRQGEYNPGSPGGRETLAHELTHVVQQAGGVRRRLTVSQPNDPYEREADRVAREVADIVGPGSRNNGTVSQSSTSVRVQRMCPECEEELHRKPDQASYVKGQRHDASGTQTRQSLSMATLEPTAEGTETLLRRGLPNVMTQDGGTATGCSVTGSFSSIPSGSVSATLTGSKLGATFSMIGEFTPSIPCNCSCGEYRQYVRGRFKRNGSDVTHALCGSNLDPTTYQEDCGRIGGTDYKYGYRSIPFATSKFTTPDQATGCKFEGYDAPGITGSSGDTLEVNLDFRGDLVDTCNGNKVLATSSWSVTGSATVP